MKCDICIIGAGPAGLMAAISAAEGGAAVVLIEKNAVAGKKLLATGGGRCNITHTGSIDDFVKAYSPYGRFLKHSLYEFSADSLRQYFADRNLATKAEKDGCVFPLTNRATDVMRILLDHARRLNIRFVYSSKVETIRKQDISFVVATAKEKFFAYAVIIAAGGCSWPHTGSSGDGYEFARQLGHTIVAPRAALVPLVAAEKWLSELAGVSLPNVILIAKPADKKLTVAGPMLFTHDGIGGPAVLNFSRLLADEFAHLAKPIAAEIDLFPQRQSDDIEKQIIELCAAHPKKELAGVLQPLMPRAMALAICKLLEPSANLLAGQLTKPKRRELVTMLKRLTIHIKHPRPIAEATITRGGITTGEIDSKTMESKICKGLFFAGEVIDADGPCGGYNLQIAFSTGRLAGKSAAKTVLNL
jgi:predicted Rossmann fold flavoprotein